jgi:hypothetical protein
METGGLLGPAAVPMLRRIMKSLSFSRISQGFSGDFALTLPYTLFTFNAV